jgi:hypothetical protein
MPLLGFVSTKIYVGSRFATKFKWLQHFQLEVMMQCDHPTTLPNQNLSTMWLRRWMWCDNNILSSLSKI